MAKLRIGRSPAAAEAACEHFQPKQFSERDWRLVPLSKQLGIGLPRGIAKNAGVSSTTLIDSLAHDLPTILDLVSGQQIQRGTGRNDGIEVDHDSVLLESGAAVEIDVTLRERHAESGDVHPPFPT